MKIHRLLQSLACAAVLACTSISAQAIQITYTLDVDTTYSGSFAGTDNNADGFLNLGELSSFAFSGIESLTVSSLSDFGSYDIAQNLWLPDAFGWGENGVAYFSFDGGNSSANVYNTYNVQTIVAADVPEPASLALIGLGLFGFAAARRRK